MTTKVSSSLVRFTPSGSGGIAETIQAALRRFKFASQWGTFAQALVAAATGRLRVGSGTTVTISANTTVPSTIDLLVEKGGLIYVNSGVTLTVEGHITAGDYEIFDGDGSVSLDNSPSPYNLAWFKTTNGYINERWDFARRGMTAWRKKVVRIPRPYAGQSGVHDDSGRLYWSFDGEMLFAAEQNQCDIYVEGEFYAAGACTNFLNFEDADKPENIYFYGTLQALAPAGTTVDNGINVKSAARLHFYGPVVLNGFRLPVKIGGSDQVAAVTDVRIPQLQASFFTDCAVDIYGKAPHTVQAVRIDVLQASAAQTTGLDVVKIRGLLRDIKIDGVYYATDTAKDGFTANDAENVVSVESNDEGTIRHVEIGAIYQANANNGVKIDSAETSPARTSIQDVVVKRIFGKFGGSAANIDYCQYCTLDGIENSSDVTIGTNAFHTRINTVGAEGAITDNGERTIINGLAKQTRGAGLPPAPAVAWPIGTVIRETSDNRLYYRIAKAGTDADFLEFGSRILRGSATYDPPSLADGDGATTTVTVTGAALGDAATCSFSLDTQGIILYAWVSAADTVSVRFQNETGSTIDLGSGTLRVSVRKT